MNWFPSDLVSAQTTSKFCQQKHYERFWPATNLVKVVPVFEINLPNTHATVSPSNIHNKYDKISNLHNEPKKKKLLVQAYVFIRYSFLPSIIVYPFRKCNFFFKRIPFKCSVYQVKMHKISKL